MSAANAPSLASGLVYDDGQCRLYHGDALDVLRRLPSASVQTCVTSPPYFGLRDYGIDGQIGLEETPGAYVSRLVDVFREVRRVLRDDGTLWLNLGDSYCAPRGNTASKPGFDNIGAKGNATFNYHGTRPEGSLKPKDLIGIPWRVAFALQADGWYLRSEIIWQKINPMPESVRDRPTRAHETVFLLSKSPRYFYDAEAIAEPVAEASVARLSQPTLASQAGSQRANGGAKLNGPMKAVGDLTGRNKRDVWAISSKPFGGAHFATFPPDLIEPCILAGTSERGCCAQCGAPWRRVVARSPMEIWRSDRAAQMGAYGRTAASGTVTKPAESHTLGWQPSCSCDATSSPCVVLDPFIGSGTTAEVAKRLGRRCIGIDLNESYLRDLAVPRCRQQALFFTETR